MSPSELHLHVHHVEPSAKLISHVVEERGLGEAKTFVEVDTFLVLSGNASHEHAEASLAAVVDDWLHELGTYALVLGVGGEIDGGLKGVGEGGSLLPQVDVGISCHFAITLVDEVGEMAGYVDDALPHLFGGERGGLERHCGVADVVIVNVYNGGSVVDFYFSYHILFLLVQYFLLDKSVAVGVEKSLKFLDLLAQLTAYIGVGNAHTVGRHFHNLGG